MIFNMSFEDFQEHVKKTPGLEEKINRYMDLLRYSVMDIYIGEYIDWNSLDMLDEKIEYLEALRDEKPLPDGYEKLMTLLPKNDDEPDDDGIVTITHWD